MTPEAFIREAESHIYKEVAKYTNVLLGQKKTASLSTGLFLRLPIVVSVEKSDSPMPSLYKELKSFLPYFSGYTKMESDAKVYMTFLYHTERDLANIMKHLPRRNIMLAFVYLHEVQHVLRKHTTSSYEKLMTRIAGNVLFPHEVINFAEDYAINYSLKDLFMEKESKLHAAWPELEEAFSLQDKVP